MTKLLVAIVLALVAGAGGVVYAVDGAVPGDPLYGLDQAVESARLSLTRDAQASGELLLSFADERVLEAEELAAKGDGEHLGMALNGYGATVSSLAQSLSTTEGSEGATLAALVDQSFSDHEARLARILPGTDEVGDNGEEEEPDDQGDYCVGADPHPVGQSLVESYGVQYDVIMSWFCDDDFGFGEIVHALETAGKLETTEDIAVVADYLLTRKAELGGWGLVWQELGLIGRPDSVPDGPPDGAGPPDDVPVGPPDHAGPKDKAAPPDDVPVGPPDHAGPKDEAGPPDDVPVGPPDHAGPKDEAGPPDDVPVGPPDHAGPKDDVGAPDDVPAGPPDHAGPADKAPNKPTKEKQKNNP